MCTNEWCANHRPYTKTTFAFIGALATSKLDPNLQSESTFPLKTAENFTTHLFR